jgi:hypothetical protein
MDKYLTKITGSQKMKTHLARRWNSNDKHNPAPVLSENDFFCGTSVDCIEIDSSSTPESTGAESAAVR